MRKRHKINKVVYVYFFISWLIGLALLISLFADAIGVIFYSLIFISVVNLFINVISIILLFVFYFVFTENRTEFKNSLILLIFNFPILFFPFLLLISNQ